MDRHCWREFDDGPIVRVSQRQSMPEQPRVERVVSYLLQRAAECDAIAARCRRLAVLLTTTDDPEASKSAS